MFSMYGIINIDRIGCFSFLISTKLFGYGFLWFISNNRLKLLETWVKKGTKFQTGKLQVKLLNNEITIFRGYGSVQFLKG